MEGLDELTRLLQAALMAKEIGADDFVASVRRMLDAVKLDSETEAEAGVRPPNNGESIGEYLPSVAPQWLSPDDIYDRDLSDVWDSEKQAWVRW